MKRIRVPNLLFCNAYSNTNLSKTFRLDSIYSACESIGVQPGHYDKLSLAKNHQLTSALFSIQPRVFYILPKRDCIVCQFATQNESHCGWRLLSPQMRERNEKSERQRKEKFIMPTQWKMVKIHRPARLKMSQGPE